MSTIDATAGRAGATGFRDTDEQGVGRAVGSLARSFDARTAMNLDACIHCGMCAEVCHYYVATEDPKYTPILKAEPLKQAYKREASPFAPLFRWLGLKPAVTASELAEWQHLVYDSCNMCGRCSLVCPMGIDVADLVRDTRWAMFEAGLAPRELEEAAESQHRSGVPWSGEEPYRDRLTALGEQHSVAIPIDREAADVMVTVSSLELEQYPGQVVALARVMEHLGVACTFRSDALLADNFAYFAGSREGQRDISLRLIEAARACGAGTVIVPECGHAYTALRWEAPDLVGEALPFRVLHISEYLAEQLDAGRLRLREAETGSATFHDPCQIVRKGGVTEAPRELLRALGVEIRESGDHIGFGYCCGGGGGVNMIERAADLRNQAVEVKLRELEAAGAEQVLTTCAGCRYSFDEARGHSRDHKTPGSLLELVAANLEGAQENDR